MYCLTFSRSDAAQGKHYNVRLLSLSIADLPTDWASVEEYFTPLYSVPCIKI